MHTRSLVLALLIVAAGCGKKAPEAVPEPAGGTTPAPPPSPTGTTPTTPRGTGDADAAAVERENLLRLLRESIHFDFDRDEIRPGDATVLDRKAAVLLANPGLRLRIAGHCDERGSDEYNLVLGTRRATSAKRYLEAKGIDGARIEVISFGEERPVDAGSNEGAWARNRRDEFEILSGAERLVPPR